MCWVILPLTALLREGYSLQCSSSLSVNEQGRGAILSTLTSDPSVLEARARVLSASGRGSPFTARHSKLPRDHGVFLCEQIPNSVPPEEKSLSDTSQF